MRISLSFVLLSLHSAVAYVVNNGTKCYVYPESLAHGGQPVDDSPSILQAFEVCGINGSVILTDNTFRIDKVMTTTNLLNCDVELHGTMIWSDNVPYWLSHSIGLWYQNHSTAWLFGGTNITFRGFGKGTFDGQGQGWYDQNRNNSNQPGRPIGITFYNSTNLFVDGLRWRQSQFWSSFISYSQNVTMTNIDIKSVSTSEWRTDNTDGTDTWNSRDVVFQNWTVQCGDDCIAIKGNSTNIVARNITCLDGVGLTIGSVAQYPDYPDYVENVLFEDCVVRNCMDGVYIKAWQGTHTDKTGNGDNGGGGGGYVRNVTWKNVLMDNVGIPIYISQCIYGGDPSVCDTSKLQISNITYENIHGTSRYALASSIHCAEPLPCPGMKFRNVSIHPVNSNQGQPIYQCANIVNQNSTDSDDFTGIPCNAWAPNNVPQDLDGDFGAAQKVIHQQVRELASKREDELRNEL